MQQPLKSNLEYFYYTCDSSYLGLGLGGHCWGYGIRHKTMIIQMYQIYVR